ncbi:MAG TPA: asparagine synthase (glutamine-hydrolyzing) [Pyrinomonadaceae bacterium]|nr:asparagine synthase (glutamine-hydrolyzing) [Pyrinomonadaceae bacterium]
MCGFAGYIDLRGERRAKRDLLNRMTDTLTHRGPDSAGCFVEANLGLGFRRLSIIDLAGGDQPLYNEDSSLVLVCNGEIYNYRELKHQLEQKGHVFRTHSDVEVLLHLYEEEGEDLLQKLNGQFAFVLYDRRKKILFLARDQFGINPLYFTVADGVLIFASEIKAILEHPLVERQVDLTGLDQILSFPGLVSPRTIFKGIESLKSGHSMTVKNGDIRITEYWDLDYPRTGDLSYDRPESFYVETLAELLAESVKYRLQADVPVGFYLSGGLDSSLIAAMIKKISPQVNRHSFSISFTDREICEAKYQKLMARHVGSEHHETVFDWTEIAGRLRDMIWHCESPVKESFNTCSLALSQSARDQDIKVILAGEGADELFAGYPGYRFDQLGLRHSKSYDLETILEDELREKLWGDKDIFYEVDQIRLREVKSAFYSADLNELFEDFDCLNQDLVNKDLLRDRHFVHQRSYLDFKLRLSDHLLSEHGDRMVLANSTEGRYPFLDIDLVEFATRIPPDLKLNSFTEKYIVRKMAEGLVPPEIIKREKFGFRAPGTPYLLRQNIEWINDLLSYERIKRQGYFNPEVTERLKSQYSQPGFNFNPHLEIDLLMVVLTFNILLDQFNLPSLN